MGWIMLKLKKKQLYDTHVFLQNTQPTKHFTFMYGNVYGSALIQKGQIFGWKNTFCIMTMHLNKHRFWWMDIWLKKNIYVGASTISLIWSQVIFPGSKK
jgi:hypothetical protein